MSLQYQQDLKQQLANRRKHTLKMDLFKSNNSKPVLNKLSNIFNVRIKYDYLNIMNV